MSHHGGGKSGGGGAGGTENVPVGPLLTITTMLPILAVLYFLLRRKGGQIGVALFVLAGIATINPIIAVLIVIAAGLLYWRTRPLP